MRPAIEPINKNKAASIVNSRKNQEKDISDRRKFRRPFKPTPRFFRQKILATKDRSIQEVVPLDPLRNPPCGDPAILAIKENSVNHCCQWFESSVLHFVVKGVAVSFGRRGWVPRRIGFCSGGEYRKTARSALLPVRNPKALGQSLKTRNFECILPGWRYLCGIFIEASQNALIISLCFPFVTMPFFDSPT